MCLVFSFNWNWQEAIQSKLKISHLRLLSVAKEIHACFFVAIVTTILVYIPLIGSYYVPLEQDYRIPPFLTVLYKRPNPLTGNPVVHRNIHEL